MNSYNDFSLCVDDDPTFFTFGWCLEVACKLPTSISEEDNEILNSKIPRNHFQWTMEGCKWGKHCV